MFVGLNGVEEGMKVSVVDNPSGVYSLGLIYYSIFAARNHEKPAEEIICQSNALTNLTKFSKDIFGFNPLNFNRYD